jgi:hypothetical protein
MLPYASNMEVQAGVIAIATYHAHNHSYQHLPLQPTCPADPFINIFESIGASGWYLAITALSGSASSSAASKTTASPLPAGCGAMLACQVLRGHDKEP